jgi:apolipoprotein D and lipocalin family protein
MIVLSYRSTHVFPTLIFGIGCELFSQKSLKSETSAETEVTLRFALAAVIFAFYFSKRLTANHERDNIMKFAKFPTMMLIAITAMGCQTIKPIHTVETVDLKRFMGDWYVIASIPTFIEKGAYNAIESYRLNDDGTVATTFTFNKGSMDGPLKKYAPRGFIKDTSSNAVWGMQFIWPFKAEYRIIFLSEDYSITVIGRTKRDYVWIMARKPAISSAEYASISKFLQEQGYDITKLQKVPQKSTPTI